MKIRFLGAAGEVTGSNHLVEADNGQKILIDCGLHQGTYYAAKENFEPFKYDPSEIEAVIVTHAHLDHTGRLPKLYHEGFRGPVYSTPPTRDFTELVLLDSEHILGLEADREGQENFCTLENIKGIMGLWKNVHYHEPLQIGPFKIELFDSGHILGSAFVRIEADGKSVVFSGDLGNFPALIVKKTEMPSDADYCVMESTYGDRVHEERDTRKELLEDIIEETVRRKGTLMIPAFALERTQELLYNLHDLVEQRRIPRMPVFIDSPLAIKMTEVYKKHENYFNPETLHIVRSGDDIMNFPGLHMTLTSEQSKEINNTPPPKIVMAGSGMSNGGRIMHHEMRYLSDEKSTILFVGYQSRGTLGRALMDGAKEVMIFGERVPVRCERRTIHGYSAHADQPRLVEWVHGIRASLKKVFLVHGEPEAAGALAGKLRDELAIDTEVPKFGDEFVL